MQAHGTACGLLLGCVSAPCSTANEACAWSLSQSWDATPWMTMLYQFAHVTAFQDAVCSHAHLGPHTTDQ